ncbi:MAG: epoxyqueuosine reductase [Clostridia bacterium]|nr:epoxyqueuosine reductase [Clostridia bacterium]
MTLSEYVRANITDDASALPLSACRIINERLLGKAPHASSVVMMAVPYPRKTSGLLASFARLPDYHGYFSRFEDEAHALLSERYGDVTLKIFADHSPIDERRAACAAGLGLIGDNGLFISKKYGSFVFLGEAIVSLNEEEMRHEGFDLTLREAEGCLHCGACRDACPAGCIGGDKSLCVSAITQKKGVLTDTERDILIKGGSAWGCDVCQSVCPMTGDASPEFNEYFLTGAFDVNDISDVERLTDEEYARYPFSWRRRDVIERNLTILEHGKEAPDD